MDYFQCTHQYGDRAQIAIGAVLDAQDRYRQAEAETRRLRDEAALLEQTLSQAQREVAELRAEDSRLRRRLDLLQDNKDSVRRAVDGVNQYLNQVIALQANLIAHDPSHALDMVKSSPNSIALAARIRAAQTNYNTRKDAAKSNITRLQRSAAETMKAYLEYLAGHITFGGIKLVLLKILRDIGLDALEGPFGMAFTIHDIYELVELGRKSWEAFTADARQ